jgi:hypothetical protein
MKDKLKVDSQFLLYSPSFAAVLWGKEAAVAVSNCHGK